jgi:hypothetical protein
MTSREVDVMASRFLVGVTVAALVAVIGLGSATPASAAERSAACAWLDGHVTEKIRTDVIDLSGFGGLKTGETVTVTGLQRPAGVVETVGLAIVGQSSTSGPIGAQLTLTTTARADELRAYTVVDPSIQYVDFVWGCDPATGGATATPIPDWIQGYARASADEVCIEGWSPSWDQWPNGGTGGYTCGRAIRAFG